MKEQALKMVYDIHVHAGPVLKPTMIEFWTQPKRLEQTVTTAPLKYMSDALVGVSLIKMNQYLKSPLVLRGVNYSFCDEAWKTLDPHFEIYRRSQTRVQSLRTAISPSEKLVLENFEQSLTEILDEANKPWGLDLTELWHLIDSIQFLEEKMKSPLLYNFSVTFSKNTVEKLHQLYSLLFHLRAIIAYDHNTHLEDPSFEAVKCDAITDYIPKAEYVSNDAVLFYQFKKLSMPFVGHRGRKEKDTRMEKLMVQPMEKLFKQYSHNAACLIESLPSSFLNKLNTSELEEALHLVQMDWLLGSEAGLLFKIREELFGLQNGYEKVFWHDAFSYKNKKSESKLTLALELKESEIFSSQAA